MSVENLHKLRLQFIFAPGVWEVCLYAKFKNVKRISSLIYDVKD